MIDVQVFDGSGLSMGALLVSEAYGFIKGEAEAAGNMLDGKLKNCPTCPVFVECTEQAKALKETATEAAAAIEKFANVYNAFQEFKVEAHMKKAEAKKAEGVNDND